MLGNYQDYEKQIVQSIIHSFVTSDLFPWTLAVNVSLKKCGITLFQSRMIAITIMTQHVTFCVYARLEFGERGKKEE